MVNQTLTVPRMRAIWRIGAFVNFCAASAALAMAGACALQGRYSSAGIFTWICAACLTAASACSAVVDTALEAYESAIPEWARDGGCSKCDARYTEVVLDDRDGLFVWHSVECHGGARAEARLQEASR